MACVYSLASSAESTHVRYVGITNGNTPNRRMHGHFCQARLGNNLPVYRWMRKHLECGNTIVVSILITGITYNEACIEEIKCIARYRNDGAHLMNMTDGGEGTVGVVWSEETKKKISKTMTGVGKSPEHCTNIGAASRATWKKRKEEAEINGTPLYKSRKSYESRKLRKPLSCEGRVNLSIAMRNSSRAKTANEARRGVAFTPEHRANIQTAAFAREAKKRTTSF